MTDLPEWRLLRRRPLIFISSAIEGLTGLRARIADRLETLDLADQWLFELHATAAGEPSEGHYLDIARSCDLMVVIVGDRRTEGTEDEYDEAFRDNPDKILPFFLGDGNDEVKPFRTRLAQPNRHVRKQVQNEDELVDAVVNAVEAAVRSGRLLSGPLRRSFVARLEALDQLISLQPPRSYIPALVFKGARLRWTDAWGRANPMLIEGPGGAGKTYGALTFLHQLSLADRTRLQEREEREQAPLDLVLPLYLRATADQHRMPGLIAQAFAAARFFPGADLTEQYAGEGRLAVVIDGYDDLGGAQREAMLQSVAEWHATYPRCRLALLARQVTENQLNGFHQLTPAAFDEDQIVEMFQCEGRPIRGMIDVPAELTDLIIWPFWCAALARFGLEASSGLALLQRIIEGRLATTHDPARASKLRAAMGWLALRAYPSPGFSPTQGIEWLAQWQQLAESKARFEPEAAESLLEAVRHSGLIQSEDQQLVFLHPLLAGVMAAEAARSDPTQATVQSGGELAVFCTALLGEGQHNAVREMLESHDIFFAARVLRLHVPDPRPTDLAADLKRYQKALRALAPLAGPQNGAKLGVSTVAVARGEAWLALTHLQGDEPDVLANYEDLTSLDSSGEVVVWQGDPFADRLPEHLAVAEILMRFKRAFDELTRREVVPDQPVPVPPKDRGELSQRLLQHARAVADVERELRAQAGLSDNLSLPTLAGEPHLVITSSNSGRWINESWGHDQAHVHFDGPTDFHGWDSVARFLATDSADAGRDRLRQRVEKEIGSALGSAAWNRPTALAGWVW